MTKRAHITAPTLDAVQKYGMIQWMKQYQSRPNQHQNTFAGHWSVMCLADRHPARRTARKTKCASQQHTRYMKNYVVNNCFPQHVVDTGLTKCYYLAIEVCPFLNQSVDCNGRRFSYAIFVRQALRFSPFPQGLPICFEVNYVPIIHCDHSCVNNMNPSDLCVVGPDVRLYWTNGLCNKYRPRPLPVPPPMIERSVVHSEVKLSCQKGGRRWKQVRLKLYR